MTQLTIRRFDRAVMENLKQRVVAAGRSMEEEPRRDERTRQIEAWALP